MAALVDVSVPTDVMLLTVKAPLSAREAKLAAPARIALVEVRVPTTVREAMDTV